MLNTKKTGNIIRHINNILFKRICNCSKNLATKIRSKSQCQLRNLTAVSREEFDIQMQVFLQTREKMIQIEKRIEKLEKRVN